MKKFFMIAAAALSLFAASCTGSAEAECEAYLKTIDSTTAAIENCNSIEELQAIATAFEAKAKDFEAKYSEETCSKELLKKIEDAATRYGEVSLKKIATLAAGAQAAE